MTLLSHSFVSKLNSAFFKELSLGRGGGGGQKAKPKYEPSRFGERAYLKRDFYIVQI